MAVSKCPCLTLSRVNVMLDAKISLVPAHQLTVPSTLLPPATNIRTHKATKQVSPTLSPQSPSLFPFPPIPYPLPLSTAATQAKYPTKNNTAGSQFACP